MHGQEVWDGLSTSIACDVCHALEAASWPESTLAMHAWLGSHPTCVVRRRRQQAQRMGLSSERPGSTLAGSAFQEAEHERVDLGWI